MVPVVTCVVSGICQKPGLRLLSAKLFESVVSSRLPVLLPAVLLAFAGSSAYAMSEWTYHRTDDGRHPSAHEQQALWLMNRARANPVREANWLATSTEYDVARGREYFDVDTTMLFEEFTVIDPSPPAAFDRRLYSAALAHANDLIARDAQDHNKQKDRVTDSGFNWREYRGNVFSYANNALNAHAAFNIDWGYGPGGMQDPRGHRHAIMSTDGKYTNVGIAAVSESNPSSDVGDQVLVGNYCRAWTSTANHYNEFIVGTVYADLNYNDRYDVGEGQSGVYVFPSKGSYYAVTSAGGGYAIPVTWQGDAEIRFGGGDVQDHAVNVTDTGESILVDYVTNVVRAPALAFPTVFLSVGDIDYGKYGFRWGTDQNPVSVKAEFFGSNDDLAIGVRGYDIDSADEVEVLVNGNSLGYLSQTGNSQNASAVDWFTMSRSALEGKNIVEFRQKTPGQKWGVSEIQLREINSTTNYLPVDGAPTSNLYGQPGEHPGIARFKFFSNWHDLMVTVKGYDIDVLGEVSVYVNNIFKGNLSTTGQNAFGSKDRFSIFRSDLNASGDNFIEFRATNTWEKWGITGLSLIDVSGPQVELIEGAPKTGEYGRGHGGSEHRISLRTAFVSKGRDVRYRFHALSIDSKREVGVFLNNEFYAYAPKTSGGAGLATEYFFPASILKWGENVVEFRRNDPSGTWGVNKVAVDDVTAAESQLTPGAIDRNRYGWGQSSYIPVRGVKRFNIDGTGKPLRLIFKAWDIDSRKEVSIYLNGEKISTRLLVTGNNLVLKNEITFSADELKQGNNRIEFVVDQAVDKQWGVFRLQVLELEPSEPRASSDLQAAAGDSAKR